ncbi:MAG: translational elongation factor EF-1 alpha [Sporothrix epigloea]
MASKAENAKSDKVLADLMQNLTIAKEAEQIKDSSSAIATFINGHIEDLDVPTKTIDALLKQLNNKKDALVREKALTTVQAIAQHADVSAHVEPFLVVLLPAVLAGAGDKITSVKTAAIAAALAIAESLSPNAVKAALPPVLESLRNAQKFPERLLALDFIDSLIRTSQVQMGTRVPELIPAVSEAMWVTKKEVSARAYKTMEVVCGLIVNKDIEKFIPELIKCIAKPEHVPETVHLLGATTFVTDVHQPTLALMVPLLDRGLAERETAIRRKSAVIVDNMCKLVDDPNVVAPFLPKMMPGLQKNYETLADPEAREKTRQALDTITRVGNVVDGKIPEPSNYGDIQVVKAHLLSILGKKGTEAKFGPVLDYVSGIAGQLIDDKDSDAQSWTSNLKSYVAVIVGDAEADTVVNNLRLKALPGASAADEGEEDEEEGEDLCNCTFNLSYGAKILLNQTHLRLKRGQRYGLCGPNGSGKSTLMRAINNEQVEGFPKQNEVKTVFVEHDLDSADTEMTTVEWTMKKLAEAKVDVSESEVVQQLNEFGFTEQMIKGEISALSGGWKMKLALCRAVFEKPDILLLDEPTNHLDVKNVKWLEDYLTNSPCTSIIVSHDSGFLDNVCQHIINYERFKLKRYRGNLKEFVRRVPAAKSYYELGASEIEFTFPEPGFLEGVKTKAKAILRATNMSFQYPNTPKPQISDITFQCSLSSRIAVIGPNGAGKSTLVNVLTGELVPTGGEVYQHENIRIAYIKQHAFAHIDNHLDKTPFEYIQWRFATGEDRETMDRASKIVTEEDEKLRDHIYMINGTQRRVDKIHSRRKLKNSYEYECSFLLGEGFGDKIKWTPMMSADNEWLPRSELLKTHSKDVIKVDEAEALASGQFRPLVKKEVEEHGSKFGLDAELMSHSRMRGLSGGQRVKVVLAACSWQRPHLIVLDEPTNYLDRDSLGALSKALKKFEGGVIIISHSAEFTKDLTEEVWAVLDGKMTPSGHNWVQGQGSGPRLKADEGDEEDKFDAMGNKIAATKKKAKLTSSEARKKKKDRMARRKRGEEVFSDEED